MLFNSAQFLFVFLPVVLAVFFTLGKLTSRTTAIVWLVIASLIFYSWDNPWRLLPIILASIAFNFVVGWGLRRRPRGALLGLGVAGNLLLLGYFKYTGFLFGTIAAMSGLPLIVPTIELPIGISFFTFTQIAFLVDTFHGEAREHKPLHYMLFVTFFPHLVAGPIYHHKEMMPQFAQKDIQTFHLANICTGLTWLSLGLAKKVLLADSVAQFATPVFSAAASGHAVGFLDGWLGALSFALQLYFDFSGYSDMAIGLALMMGIRVPLNFDSPYKAMSIIEFWRRWHMTLSRFLRDYLYIPLGGNRKGPNRRYLNLLLTMLLGGLWHGAAWNFVLWGGIHGAGLIVNHVWQGFAEKRRIVLPGLIAWALTFCTVVLAWVPFRADGFRASVTIWQAMVGVYAIVPAKSALDGKFAISAAWITALLALAMSAPNTQTMMDYRFDRQPLRPSFISAAVAGLLFGAVSAGILVQRPTEFLYFRF